MEESRSEQEEEGFDQGGLGTQLIPKSKVVHKGSYDLENFLSQL